MKEAFSYTAYARDNLERELAYTELMERRAHGIEVFLFWHKNSNCLSIMLNDESVNQSFHFTVPNDKGIEAFNHPFPYAYEAGVIPDGTYNKH